jgi:hypothetical protein
MKQILFYISIAVAWPPPIDIVKKVRSFTNFAHNNIIFRYTDFLDYDNAPDCLYYGKWCNRFYTGYKYHRKKRLLYIEIIGYDFIEIIGYDFIEDGPHDTFICYK